MTDLYRRRRAPPVDPRMAFDAPSLGARTCAPSPRTPSPPTLATRTAASPLAQVSLPRFTADDASENPLSRPVEASCTKLSCSPDAPAYPVNRTRVRGVCRPVAPSHSSRHRSTAQERLAGFGLVRMHPGAPVLHIHLVPSKARDVGTPQAFRQREGRHVCQVGWQIAE